MYKLKVQNKNEKFNEFLNSGILGIENVVIAGGANRTFVDKKDEIHDFDVFFLGTEPKTKLLQFCSKYENVFTCPDGFLYSYKTPFGKLQIVCPTTYPNVEELLNTFDLQPSRFAFDGEYLYTFKEAIKSVKKKSLDIHTISYPLATMNRIFKYRNYGYNTIKANEQFIRTLTESTFEEGKLYQKYID
jgi:hypothetical protein